MCTATWALRAGGYDLLFNRDERRMRSPGLPPRCGECEGVRFVAPRDTEAGGTWMGTNELGVTVFLLNLHGSANLPSSSTLSRGLLVHRMLPSVDLQDAEKRFARVDLTAYRLFTLGIMDPRSGIRTIAWNGVEAMLDRLPRAPLSSSSFATDEVLSTRRRTYHERFGDLDTPTPLGLREFHASHVPRVGPFSVCMHREDACTVSFSHVSVREDTVTFAYARESLHDGHRTTVGVAAYPLSPPFLSKEHTSGSVVPMVTREMIKALPKVSLHDHLDGGLRPQTIIDLAEANNIEIPSHDPVELEKWFHRGADRKTLSLYLEGFAATLAVMQTEEALRRVALEAIEDLHAEGVVYAELRFAPVLHTGQGLNLEKVVRAVLLGLEQAREQTGVQFGVILCAMRDQDQSVSLETAELAVAFRDKGVVGFDLAGDEYGHPPKRHLAAFEYIRQKNFNITIHAGEAFGPDSIWQAVQICGAHRIGHGVRLAEDMSISGTRIEKMGSLGSFIRDKRIPLEICISSNVHTGAAASPDDHPFGILYRNNYRVCLNTDNRLMSNTTLGEEMHLAAVHYNLTLDDLGKLTINAMKSAFIEYDTRLGIIYDILKPAFAKMRENITSIS